MVAGSASAAGRSHISSISSGVSPNAAFTASETLAEGGVDPDRAASSLTIGVKQYARRQGRPATVDARTGREEPRQGHGGLQLVGGRREKVERVKDLKEHLHRWVADRKQEAAGPGKEKKVREVPTSLAAHWAALLRGGEALDDSVPVPEEFQADIDAKAHRVTLEGDLDLANILLQSLALAEIKLAKVLTVMGKSRAARDAVEGPRGPQDVALQDGGGAEAARDGGGGGGPGEPGGVGGAAVLARDDGQVRRDQLRGAAGV